MRKIISTAVTIAFAIWFTISVFQLPSKGKIKEIKETKSSSNHPVPVPQPFQQSVPQQVSAPVIVENHPQPETIVPRKGFFQNRLSEKTTLHAIGVYEGENESGKDDPPWWSKCPDLRKGGAMDAEAARECQQKYASLKTPKNVTVDISYNKSPIVVVLMAYNPVIWEIKRAGHGVDIEGIILGGYEQQTLTGELADGRVIAYTYKTPECGACTRGNGYFHAYSQDTSLRHVEEKLLKITGKQLSSFQGSYKANHFNISNSID
ncbi:MAG: hypothetical protein KJ630_02470 [Proteobacteria bacterium]|nr:hypothetical protein [Pseudomonadota bacterium]